MLACDTPTNVPDTAVAVIVNLVATQPSAFGWLTAFPADDTIPEASSLLFYAGKTVPDLAIVKVDTLTCNITVANSKSTIRSQPGGRHHPHRPRRDGLVRPLGREPAPPRRELYVK